MMSVDNIKRRKIVGDVEIYIGREGYGFTESVLANPRRFKKYGRAISIEKYRRYLYDAVRNGNNDMIKELLRIESFVKEGKHVVLLCWCKPLACHGDVIVDLITYWLKNEPIVK